MVPATRPLHALYLFECFLYGQDGCKSFSYPADNLEYLTGEDVVYVPDEGDDDDDVAFSASPAVKPWHYAVWYSVLVVGTIAGVVVVNRVAKKPQYTALTGDSKPMYAPTE
ncbi:Aste57867_4430 [Aphanomyces stellatus]|uniref:Aste57867_4430 protein n=1 Tax=Aphanomyces stellatus TaxID=120398 RepID=A0A485KBR4_9STRA|nr:hypothetical protein As57867_004418 [Aphanomyces stellatus]VFT81541.1 Aste57867_4430 [Aphanomyces stellatus]